MSEYDRYLESNTKRSSAVESMEKVFGTLDATTKRSQQSFGVLACRDRTRWQMRQFEAIYSDWHTKSVTDLITALTLPYDRLLES